MYNAGVVGHSFAYKFKMFENEDIFEMLDIYMLGGLSETESRSLASS